MLGNNTSTLQHGKAEEPSLNSLSPAALSTHLTEQP